MATVLVVDDSPIDRRLVGGILEKISGTKTEYAGDGAEALLKIERSAPDVVLTDLQMPKMDGLELVSTVRSRFPLVPVILMTGHGSEDIAVQALQRGAASYVNKSSIADELPDVLETVLHIAKADRHNERLGECITRTITEFVLPNDTALVYPLVDHCQQLVTRMRLCDETGRIRVGIALEEALLNALYHGNLELTSEALHDARSSMLESDGPNLIEQRCGQQPYRDRRIHMQISVSADEAQFTVRDEGKGFDHGSVPDPTDPANLERESGRGLLLMKTFMDDVQYSNGGNEVKLTKRREKSALDA